MGVKFLLRVIGWLLAIIYSPHIMAATTITRAGVFIYKRTGNTWSLEKSFLGSVAVDRLGISVSLSKNRLAVGAYGDDGYSGSNTGAVYIYKYKRHNLDSRARDV